MEIVETGNLSGQETEKMLLKYLAKPLSEGVDVVVFGCTHFSFLSSMIRKIFGRELKIVDPSKPVARQTLRVYQKMRPNELKFVSVEDEFYTSENSEKVSRIASKLLKRKIGFKAAD